MSSVNYPNERKSPAMMAVVKTTAEPGFEYTRVPRPTAGVGQVVIRVERAAICGTDILMYKWDPLGQQLVGDLPFIPGHECCGKVVEIGTDVEGLPEGARVCAETHIPCGHCYQCTHKLQHLCQNLVLFGHQIDGCFAEYAMIPASAVYQLSTDLSPEIACLLEPFGVSLRAVEEVAPRGDTLAVTGCGPIGLFAIGIARYMGAAKIIASDINPFRLNLAMTMGADVVVDAGETDLQEAILSQTSGDGVGCIIEASGVPSVINNMFSYLRKGGFIVQVGNPKGPVQITDVMPDLMHKELTLKTVHGRRMFETWEKSEALLSQGKVDITPVITHCFPMKQFDEAFTAVLSGQAGKVQLIPSLGD